MKTTLLSFAAISCITFAAQAQLTRGDLAPVMVNGDAPDAFAWVPLVEIAPGTVIHFTDSSYGNDSGGTFVDRFRFTEHLAAGDGGPLTWSSASSLTPGTVVVWDGTGWNIGNSSGTAPSLSNDGDQLFIYTGIIADAGGSATYRGDPSGANLLFGANFANSGWITSGDGSTGNSYLPASLIGHNLALGTVDNHRYNGVTTGTPEELLAAILNPGNWVSDNSTAFTWTAGNFTVVPEPSTATLLALGTLSLLARRQQRVNRTA